MPADFFLSNGSKVRGMWRKNTAGR